MTPSKKFDVQAFKDARTSRLNLTESETRQPSPASRSPFARDVDRIIYSQQFLRLAQVTQVVHSHELLHHHSRYSHSLKVANVAQRITDHLLQQTCEKERFVGETALATHLDRDVTLAAGLAHDIGHSPYGHIGQDELDTLLQVKLSKAGASVPEGFEGNAQTFRVLARLSDHFSATSGLGLTRATLRAVLKYPYLKGNGPDSDGDEYGAYRVDGEAFAEVTSLGRKTENKPNQVSIEAAVMDWADDIAYSIHDFEDFYRAGLIPADTFHMIAQAETLLQAVDQRGESREAVFLKSLPEAPERSDRGEVLLAISSMTETFAAEDSDVNAFREFLSSFQSNEHIQQILADDKVRDAILLFAATSPYRNDTDVNRMITQWRSALVRDLIKATSISSDDEGFPVLKIPSGIRNQVNGLKRLTRLFVHDAPSLRSQQAGKRAIIRTLFESFAEPMGAKGSFNDDRAEQIALLSPPWVAALYRDVINTRARPGIDWRIDRRGVNKLQCERWGRITVDLIASLTDQEASRLALRMGGIDIGNVTDRLW